MDKQWTVKEIADVLGCSKPTVQKAINENDIKCDEYRKNRQIFYSSTARKIIELIKKDFDFEKYFDDEPERKETEKDGFCSSGETANGSQNSANESENFEKKLENLEKELQNIAKNRQEEIEFLREQIRTKDDIIRNLTAKNDSLLASNLKLNQMLEDKQQERQEVIIEPDAKQGFFRHLFGKKG